MSPKGWGLQFSFRTLLPLLHATTPLVPLRENVCPLCVCKQQKLSISTPFQSFQTRDTEVAGICQTREEYQASGRACKGLAW